MTELTEVRWPRCERAGCSGVRLSLARMCLAHASDDETAPALKLIGETGAIDVRGTTITPALLERILTAVPRGKNQEPLIKDCQFRRTIFSGHADFRGASFGGHADFGGATFEDDTSFSRATFKGNASFGEVIFGGANFKGGAWFREATFEGDAWFRTVTFEGDADFGEATFEGRASFGEVINSATFNGRADFHGATFNGDTSFGGVAFKGDADFGEATFEGRASFGEVINSATFNGRADFHGATFNGDTSFGGVAFEGDADFGEATFEGRASFGEVINSATFNGRADFQEATFDGDTSFGGVSFKADADFRYAAFEDDASFCGTIFKYSVNFEGTAFKRRADFGDATFIREASFYAAAFSGEVSFYAVTFRRLAGFSSARFEQARQLGPLLAYRGLLLDDVQFAQPVQIEVSSTGVCCRRARFLGGVQFRIRWACVVLDDTDLAEPSILAGVPHLSAEQPIQLFSTVDLGQQEEQMAKLWRRLLKDEISERPQLLSLRRANVAGLGLSNISAANCRFEGAHNLDKLRLESSVSFAPAPSPLGPGGQGWGGREVIAEERTWRANRSHPRSWIGPWWPGWLGKRPEALEPGQIAGLYRALRKGREDAKDEPGAADFYYGEMEMRRKARPLSASNPDSQPAVASRGQVERGILTAYWLVSGYGLRAWRAVACLTAVTAFLAIAFHAVGFAVPPRPVSYWTSWLYAFRATLSLTDDQVTLTVWGQLLQGILRLTGPVLLGLALLALRGRVRR